MKRSGHETGLDRILTTQVCCTDGFASSRVRMNGLNNAVAVVPFLATSIAAACPRLIIRVFGEEVVMSVLSPFLGSDDIAVNAGILRLASMAIRLCHLAPGPFSTWCLLRTDRVRAIVVLDYYHLSNDRTWGVHDTPIISNRLVTDVTDGLSDRRLNRLTTDLWVLNEMCGRERTGSNNARKTSNSIGDPSSIQELENRFVRFTSSGNFPLTGLRELYAAMRDESEREVSLSGGEHPALASLLTRLIQDVEQVRLAEGGLSMMKPANSQRIINLIK